MPWMIASTKQYFLDAVMIVGFIAVVLLLTGCMSDEEFYARTGGDKTPAHLAVCVSDSLDLPLRKPPEIVVKDGTWIADNGSRVKGEVKDGKIYVAHADDTETIAHEIAHYLGERNEQKADWAGKRCA